MTLEPNYVVLLALGADANDPDPAFTDVSSDLLSVQVDRGSPSDLDRNNPGTCTFVLDNYSGDYDNENADSPYVGNLVPMTQVLVYAEYDGELYPRFRGFLDDVQLSYLGPATATATFTATDGFKPLAQTTLPSSVYVAEVLADGPVALWRLDEPDGNTTVWTTDGDGTRDDGLEFSGSPELGTTGLVSREPGSAMAIADGTLTGAGMSDQPFLLPASPLSIELVYRHVGPGVGLLAGQRDGEATNVARVGISGSELFEFSRNASGISTTSTTGSNITDGNVHHVVYVWAANGNLLIYVDGVQKIASPATVTAGAFSVTSGTTHIGGGPFGFGADGCEGVYQMVAFYDYALSAARIAAHADAVSTPWNNDTPAARADRICDVVGWPAEMRDFDTGASTLQSANLDMEALEHLQKVAESEFGGLFCALDGTLTMRERGTLINRPPLATFGDANGEVGYRSITFDSSDELLRNPVTISRAEGVAQTAQDSANVTRYYPHQYTLDGLYHDDDALSLDAAQFFVSEYKDPKRRITGLGFGPAEVERIDDWYPLLLTAELGDVFEVVFRPPNVATPFEQRSVLEGTSETWTPAAGHAVSWFLSPAYTGDFLELDAGSDNDGLDSARLFF